jgi:hypothetical protein
MPCPKCLHKSGFHSFSLCGKINHTNLFYSSLSKSSDTNSDGTMLENIIIHMIEDTKQKSWIWVLNCENMGLKEYTNVYFSIGLLNHLSKDTNLQDVWLINSNLWIQATYRILNSISDAKFLKQIKMIDGSTLEKLDILKKLGLDTKASHWLVAQ